MKPIGDLYSEKPLYEWRRLVRDAYHSLEFNFTSQFLKKYLPEKGLVLDGGGGPGRYTIELAKQNYDVVLLDFTPKLLEVAKRQIARAKVKNKVKQVVEGSIVDLSAFPDNHFDAVICLGGPLSHVEGENNRKKALSELVRVAKPGAPIFVSVMGRIGALIRSIKYWPEEIGKTEHFRKFVETGDDDMFHGESYCHFFLPEELDKLVETDKVEVLEKVGLEGLTHLSEAANKLHKNSSVGWNNWLAANNFLRSHPAVYGSSDHMMVVLRKK